MTHIRKTDNDWCWCRCSERKSTYPMLLVMFPSSAPIENSMEVSQKIKNRADIQPSNSTLWYQSPGHKNMHSKGHMTPLFISAFS